MEYLKSSFGDARSLTVALALAATLASTVEGGRGDGPCASLLFEQTPSPLDESELFAIATTGHAGGPIAIAGRMRTFSSDGSPYFPLVMERMGPGEQWIIHDAPDFGFTWHQLQDILYLPGEENDLVVVGGYLPDPSLAYYNGFVMRYRRAEQKWETYDIIAPESFSTGIRGAMLDPRDSNRLILYGGRATAPGFCFAPRPMLVEFDLATNTHSFVDMGDTRGTIHAVIMRDDGRLLATGIDGTECDFTYLLQVLHVQDGSVTIAPSPLPLDGFLYSSLLGLTRLADGRILAVGYAHKLPGFQFVTLSYRLDPATEEWELIKPIDPSMDLPNGDFLNQLFRIAQAPNGTVYAAGRRTHYLNGYRWKAMVQRFDGESWCVHELPEFLGEGDVANSQILGLAVTDTDFYAAGWWSPPGSFAEQTLVLHGPVDNGSLPGDLNGDGVVDIADLLILLAEWGPCGNCNDCPADLTENGAVGVMDLLILLNNWG